VALLVLAAALKTAAFPLHGWLTEVMEAPTPVSALLHAGIVNAGGFLLIRMAEVVQASPGAMAALVMIGGLTALFGAVVMLTQSAVKTALAWSTVAQMGFMLLQCGLGLWALALLHIVAHALYKAHAFLSSGGAVQAVAAVRRPGPVAVPGLGAVTRAFLIAVLLYAAVAAGFTSLAGEKSPQALALGMILVFGVAYLVAQGLADAAPAALTKRAATASAGAAIAYFAFHQIAGALWGGVLPPAPAAGALEWALIVLALLSFGLVAVAQALFPLWSHHPAAAGMRVHLANGLYLNALLDRLIGGLKTPKSL
jgi:NAD(P)H-quinone oxidoreductase subunit 5